MLESASHFVAELFPRIAWVHLLPHRRAQNPYCTGAERQKRTQDHELQPIWEGFLLRHVRWIQHLDGRNLLGLFDLGQFVLLGQEFVNGFLDFGLAVQVPPLHTQ